MNLRIDRVSELLQRYRNITPGVMKILVDANASIDLIRGINEFKNQGEQLLYLRMVAVIKETYYRQISVAEEIAERTK
jgi:hypothetical protein